MTSLVSEGGMSNGRPMDVHWTGRTIRRGQRSLMANLDMSESLPSVHLDHRSLLGLTTLVAAFLNSSKCGSYAWYGLVSGDPEF